MANINQWKVGDIISASKLNEMVNAINSLLQQEIPGIDTSNLITTEQLTTILQGYSDVGHTHNISEIVDLVLPTVPTKLSQLENDTDFTTVTQVNQAIANAQLGGSQGTVDLSSYAKKTDIPTKTSQLTNDTGFITEIPTEYITETELNSKGLATETFVTNKIAEAQLGGGQVDLSNYVTDVELNQVVNDINTRLDNVGTGSDTSVDFIPVTDELLSSQSYAYVPKETNSKVTVNTQLKGLKCRLTGLNLFNPDEGLPRISGGAYSAIPIYVKPNTHYDVYVYYKLSNAESNGLTNQIIINTDAFGFKSGSSGMTLKDLKANKKQTLTTKSHGCLYISFVYGDNESLNRLLNAFDIMIVEAGTSVEGYVKGVSEFIDINVGETVVDTKEYNNLFFNIDRNSEANMETALPACDINITKVNLDYDVLKNNLGLSGQIEKSPLIYFTENYASFIYSPRVPDAFQNINADIKISGAKGDTILHVLPGSAYGISDFINFGNWNGVIGYGNNIYKSCLVTGANADANTISVYPPLVDDITDGTLGNMLIDGMHLTKNGYRAYIQHNFSQNPKYCEKGKFLYRFNPSVDESLKISPFTLIDGSGRTDITIGRLNVNVAVRNALGPITYNVDNAWNELLEVKTGVQWEVPLNQYTGYLEIFVSNGNNDVTNIMCDKGFEMHIEFYLDGQLKTEYIKDTRHLECLRFDFDNANVGKIVLYFNKIRKTIDTIRISQATWWVNEYKHSDRLIPNYAVVAQMFDSWGVYHDGETGTELSRLICESSGLTVPYTNNSKGAQTSAWGKAWWYENVRKHNPNIMITDFGINDANSSYSDGVPATVQGPDGKTYNNHISIDEYVTNMNIIFKMCILNNIQPIMFGGCIGSSNIGVWYNTLCQGTQYPL